MITQALTILIVGMITVFFILWLIMQAGKMLILLTNRFSKPSIKQEHPANDHVIDPRKLAVISATVVHLTNGMGSVKQIQKI